MEADAALLVSTYDANELAGDHKFKGKRVKVSGTIFRIAAGPDGIPFVVFSSTNRVMSLLQCYFPKESTEALVSLKKGQKFTTTCTVKGKTSPLEVSLENCAID